MRLIWQIVTGTVGEALKSGMVINVNPRRVPLSANSFTPYTQLRNLPKFSKGQVTGPIPFGPNLCELRHYLSPAPFIIFIQH